MIALVWGLSCGFGSFLPYFYVFFFTGMISHRLNRDVTRCAEKYGDDWKEYVRRVC
jgi:delta24(24(1))-sterol reductase